MLNEEFRWIYHYYLKLTPSPPEAPVIPLESVLPEVERLFEKGNTLYEFNKGTSAMRVSDIILNHAQKQLVMLVRYSDLTGSDPAFEMIQTGAVRIEPKRVGEGLSVAAHIVISTEETAPGSSSYAAVLESVPGISRTRLQRYLTYLFKEASSGVLTFIDAKGAERECRPIVEIDARPSETLIEGLRRGELKEIELVEEVPVEGMDQASYARERIRTTKVRAKPKLGFDAALSFVNSLFRQAKETRADNMKVRFKLDGKMRQMDIDIDAPDAADTQFTRYDRVELDEPLHFCSTEISKDLRRKMERIIVDAAPTTPSEARGDLDAVETASAVGLPTD